MIIRRSISWYGNSAGNKNSYCTVKQDDGLCSIIYHRNTLRSSRTVNATYIQTKYCTSRRCFKIQKQRRYSLGKDYPGLFEIIGNILFPNQSCQEKKKKKRIQCNADYRIQNTVRYNYCNRLPYQAVASSRAHTIIIIIIASLGIAPPHI